MIQIVDKGKCFGCTACVNACPQNCIQMVGDEEGFLYPSIDTQACTDCGTCETVCPATHPPALNTGRRAFVIQNRNHGVLASSTAGGFYSILGNHVIQKGGFVSGAAFDKDFSVVHAIASSADDLQGFQGSKYVQSDLGGIFSGIKDLLDQGRLVCFSGTPCQVAGLKSFLGKEYDDLITVDFICRSIPSPGFWAKYLEYQKAKYKSQIHSVRFRNKTYGYHNSTIMIQFTNGKQYFGSNHVDFFGKLFHGDSCSRPSCYSCPFKTADRSSDFTIFDCWHPELLVKGLRDNDQGYTNVIAHTAKAVESMKELGKKMDCYETEAEKALAFTGEMATKSISRNEARNYFFKLLNSVPFQQACLSATSVSGLDIMRERIKPVFYKLNLLRLFRH